MSDHMAEQLRTWSPGQAVTPGECSPGCESCKPACGCQHVPARVETTTGVGESWTGTGQQGVPIVVTFTPPAPAAEASRRLIARPPRGPW